MLRSPQEGRQGQRTSEGTGVWWGHPVSQAREKLKLGLKHGVSYQQDAEWPVPSVPEAQDARVLY